MEVRSGEVGIDLEADGGCLALPSVLLEGARAAPGVDAGRKCIGPTGSCEVPRVLDSGRSGGRRRGTTETLNVRTKPRRLRPAPPTSDDPSRSTRLLLPVTERTESSGHASAGPRELAGLSARRLAEPAAALNRPVPSEPGPRERTLVGILQPEPREDKTQRRKASRREAAKRQQRGRDAEERQDCSDEHLELQSSSVRPPARLPRRRPRIVVRAGAQVAR